MQPYAQSRHLDPRGGCRCVSRSLTNGLSLMASRLYPRCLPTLAMLLVT